MEDRRRKMELLEERIQRMRDEDELERLKKEKREIEEKIKWTKFILKILIVIAVFVFLYDIYLLISV